MLNTYGLKMKGIKKASGETVNWSWRFGGHTQISYDKGTGDIYTDDHIGESWSEYHDPDVITVANTRRHLTMQQIADRIKDALDQEEIYQSEA